MTGRGREQFTLKGPRNATGRERSTPRFISYACAIVPIYKTPDLPYGSIFIKTRNIAFSGSVDRSCCSMSANTTRIHTAFFPSENGWEWFTVWTVRDREHIFLFRNIFLLLSIQCSLSHHLPLKFCQKKKNLKMSFWKIKTDSTFFGQQSHSASRTVARMCGLSTRRDP